MVQGYEKRESPRVRLDTPVRYTVDGQQWQENRSMDVSPTGMMLRCDEDIHPGQNIRLTFTLPNMRWQDPIQAEAEVMRLCGGRKGRQGGLGIRFVSLRAGDYKAVEEFVERILGMKLDGLEELGTRGEDGEYSIQMDRLVGDVMEGGRRHRLAPSYALEATPVGRSISLLVKLGLVAVLLFLIYLVFDTMFTLGVGNL